LGSNGSWIGIAKLANDLEKASRKDIVQEVNVQLEELNSTIAEFRKPHRAVYAQLLIQELAAREQRWQSRIKNRFLAWSNGP
jgi:hypothetical protein